MTVFEQIKFVHDAPALLIKKNQENILIIADLHLGIEHSQDGVNIPSQTSSIGEEIIKLIKKVKANELILLGDIKHSIPKITLKEWLNIPEFFTKISNIVPISIIRGNHDGDIDGLTLSSINIYRDLIITIDSFKIGLIHGHTMIPLSFFQTDVIIMGHNHPIIEFEDDLGVKSFKPVWIRAKWDRRKMAKTYLQYRHFKPQKDPLEQFQKKFNVKIGTPDIIIMPAFNNLIKGYSINKNLLKLLGPIFQSQAIKLSEAEVIMLDGTYLGKLGEIISGK